MTPLFSPLSSFIQFAQSRKMMPTDLFGNTLPFTRVVFVTRDEPVFNSKEMFAYGQVIVLVRHTFQPWCFRSLVPTITVTPSVGDTPWRCGGTEHMGVVGFTRVIGDVII